MITTDVDMSAQTLNSLCLDILAYLDPLEGNKKNRVFQLTGTLMLSPKITAGSVTKCFWKRAGRMRFRSAELGSDGSKSTSIGWGPVAAPIGRVGFWKTQFFFEPAKNGKRYVKMNQKLVWNIAN